LGLRHRRRPSGPAVRAMDGVTALMHGELFVSPCGGLATFFGGVSAQRSPSQLPLAPAQPSQQVPEAEVHTAASACWFLVGGGVASTGFFVCGV
jgi:hypothetical protein